MILEQEQKNRQIVIDQFYFAKEEVKKHTKTKGGKKSDAQQEIDESDAA